MPQSRTIVAARLRPSLEELETRYAPAVTIRFDYALDSLGFFNDPSRRAALERAAATITPRLNDTLSAVAPSGGNSWQATFFNPVTNGTVTLTNPTIGQDELVVYIAGAPIGDGELGLTTTGGFSASGSRTWLNTVRTRGQDGVLASPKTDYTTWGGMITFDSRPQWHFGSDNPAPTQFDFESVAVHELMHVLGFGLGEPAFTRHVAGGLFIGPEVVAAAGAPVPVVGSPPDHWAQGTTIGGHQSPLAPALPQGQKRPLTSIDYAALDDIGWDVVAPGTIVSPAPVSPAVPPVVSEPVSVPVPPPEPILSINAPSAAFSAVEPAPDGFVARFAAGTLGGASVYDPNGSLITTARPFNPGSTAVRVGMGDVNADRVPDLVVASGPGQSNIAAVVDGRTGNTLASFRPFEESFTGGVFVALGDVNGDGTPDVVLTPDESGGPVVAVYDGAALGSGRVAEVARFLGINDPDFRGGARVGLGDVDGDGSDDLVVSAGTGGGPRVAVYDGKTVPGGRPVKLTPDFFAFEQGLRNGSYVAVADVDGDGKGEVVTGAGPGGAPRVRAFSGRELVAGRQIGVADFFTGSLTNRGGVRIATADLDTDGRADLIAGDGAGGGGRVTAFRSRDLTSGTPAPRLSLIPLSVGSDGVFVG